MHKSVGHGTKTQAAEWERDTSSNTSSRACKAAVGQFLASDRQPRSSSTANGSAAIGQSFRPLALPKHYSPAGSGRGILSSIHHFENTPFSRRNPHNGTPLIVSARCKACHYNHTHHVYPFVVQRTMEERQCHSRPYPSNTRFQGTHCYGFHEHGRTIDNR
jgi:hypothetical protein